VSEIFELVVLSDADVVSHYFDNCLIESLEQSVYFRVKCS
jgi:hypothetical protein